MANKNWKQVFEFVCDNLAIIPTSIGSGVIFAMGVEKFNEWVADKGGNTHKETPDLMKE